MMRAWPFALSCGTERQYPYHGSLWTLAPAQWVRSVVDDGRGFITLNDPTVATVGVLNRELVIVTGIYGLASDGTTATTLLLAPSTFAWDGALAQHVDVVDLMNRTVDVHVNTDGYVRFISLPQ